VKTLIHKFAALITIAAISLSAFASDVSRVRVVNETNVPIYVHIGGFAPSQKILPGQWHIYYYPFEVIPPGESKPIKSSKIVASAGGRWMTSPNGVTFLHQPELLACLDYANKEHQGKIGNRIWKIKLSKGKHPDCNVLPFKQPWYQSSK